jgi:5-methyltetrahydrofolate--homocysteine methyltransferase
METKVTSEKKEVIISIDRPAVLIGERINPSGREKMSAALKVGDLEIVRKEAIAQVEAGADILDININAPGVDDTTIMPEAVKVVMAAVDVPLCFDSSNPDAIEAALKVYKGKPLINSVSGEERSLKRVLPLVKEYGAAVIGMVQDDAGIPRNADRRVQIAHKIVESTEKAGIPREDVVIDVMAFAIGAEAQSGKDVLEATRRIKEELGVNITLGVSNVSFGMPNRALLNNTWISMVIAAGATVLIADTKRVRPTVISADLILGRDRFARRYIENHRKRQQQAQA